MNAYRYSMKEKKNILQYIISNNAYNDVKGRTFWIDFAKNNTSNRTWQGLKEVFIKRIITDLHNPYYELSPKEINSFRLGYGVLGKTHNWSIKKGNPSSSIKEGEKSLPDNSSKDKIDEETPKNGNTSSFKITNLTYSSSELETSDEEQILEDESPMAHASSKKDVSTQKKAAVTPSKTKKISDVGTTKESEDIFKNDEAESAYSSDSTYHTCKNKNDSNIKSENLKSKKSNIKDLFGFSSGKTLVKRNSCTNRYSNGILIHKCCDNNRNTPRKRSLGECSYKNDFSCTSSSQLCSSDVSDSDTSPHKRTRISQKQPLFVCYKGELYPVKCVNSKYSYSEPLHVHFRHDDKSLYKSKGVPEKNRSDKMFPTKVKHLNSKKPGKSAADKIYISSDDEFPTDNARFILDFPDEASELRYYRDMEKYREGVLLYKPSKEDYQRILSIEEKKKHKKYAHLYKDNKLCQRKVVDQYAVQKFDDSVSKRLESIQDVLDGDPECTALYWKLKYLMEKKLNEKLNVQENILDKPQEEIIAKNVDGTQQNDDDEDDDVQLVAENNNQHNNSKNVDEDKNICQISLKKKGADVFHNSYTLNTEKIDAFIDILCDKEKPQSSKSVQKKKVVEKDAGKKYRRIIQKKKVSDTSENEEAEVITSLSSNVENTNNNGPVEEVILKEQVIFDKIKNTNEEVPVTLNEDRNLFSSLEVQMYLSGTVPTSENTITEETKTEISPKNVKTDQEPKSSKKKASRISLSSNDSKQSSKKESSTSSKITLNKELKNLVIDMKEKFINRSSRRIQRISPQPISRRKSIFDPNIKLIKKKQITKETLNSKQPAAAKITTRFTTTPMKTFSKLKKTSALSKSMINIDDRKAESGSLPQLKSKSDESLSKTDDLNSSSISRNDSELKNKSNDTLIFQLDDIVFVPQNEQESESQNKIIAFEKEKIELFNITNEMRPTDDWYSLCEENSEELFFS